MAPYRVGVALDAYHEAVAQRCHLVVVADTRHGAAGGYDVSEMVEQAEHFLLIHGVGVFALYASYLLSRCGDACLRATPHRCCRSYPSWHTCSPIHGQAEFVTVEVFQRGLEGLVSKSMSSDFPLYICRCVFS